MANRVGQLQYIRKHRGRLGHVHPAIPEDQPLAHRPHCTVVALGDSIAEGALIRVVVELMAQLVVEVKRWHRQCSQRCINAGQGFQQGNIAITP